MSKAMQVALEKLLGRTVIDGRGRRVGRIEEIQAEREGPEWVVRGYVLGVDGLIERLAAGAIVQGLLGTLAGQRRRRTVAWDELDLSDPDRPRLRSSGNDKRRLSA
jgi:hypothetical protein